MVGFSLVHSNVCLLLTGSLLLLLGWFLSVLVRSIWVACRGRRPHLLTWCALALTALLLGILCVPYGSWQRLGADAIAKGPHAAEFLTFAAATGDLATVESLLTRGVSINAVDSEGSTAIYGAAVEGQLTVIEYLLAHGADPNIPNQYGQTPLGAAREMHRSDAERYLLAHGAK
jgi:ankyrin repeat protein